jgi:hypothetical protein
MMFSELVITACLALAVCIVAAALGWALLETRRGASHHQKRSLSRHLKTHKRPFKAHDG